MASALKQQNLWRAREMDPELRMVALTGRATLDRPTAVKVEKDNSRNPKEAAMPRKITEYLIVVGTESNLVQEVNNVIKDYRRFEPFGSLVIHSYTDEQGVQQEEWLQPMVHYEDV